MVRALTGCLVAVGDGRREPAWAGQVLRAGLRDPGVTVLHAHGLTLEEVAYPADGRLAAQASAARTVRTLGSGRPDEPDATEPSDG
jgi:tRNA pseudouridine38-40 synthase